MSVRIVRLRHPRNADTGETEPREVALVFERAYQLEDRLIAVGPLNDGHENDHPRQYTRRHLVEVDFDTVDVIPYPDMIAEIGGNIQAMDREGLDRVVERLS